MRVVRFFGGPVDGLLLGAEDLQPLPRFKGWAEVVQTPYGPFRFDDRIKSWNQAPGCTFRVDEDGAVVWVMRDDDVSRYSWCAGHEEYEFDTANRVP